MSEGKIEQTFNTLWHLTETPNKAYTAIEVHALKRVLLGEAHLIFNQAKADYPWKPLLPSELTVENLVEQQAKVNEWFERWFGLLV
jgi:hypothetical protein